MTTSAEPCPVCQSRQCDGLCHLEGIEAIFTPTHRPSGRMCAECVHAMRTCGYLPFHTMQPIGKPDADGTQRVRCTGYAKAT